MKERLISYLVLFGGVFLLLLTALAIGYNLPTFLLISHIALWVVPGVLGLCLVYMGVRRLAHDLIDLQEKRLDLTIKQEKHALETYLAHTRLAPDANSNYPILLPQTALSHEPVIFTQHRRVTVSEVNEREREKQQDGAAFVGRVLQPTQASIISQLEENSLTVSPGVRRDTGEPVLLSIPEAVHFKLIGSSGFGKSCLAGSLLDQAIHTNSPDYLQIALLDLEHKTSRLFEHSPNVATISVGARKVPMVATDADEVARHLGHLVRELTRRANLTEYDLQNEPLLLIYVEEMLSLQYEVEGSLLARMLQDLSILAVRGRKYGMFLLACSQTDYSTPGLRTAQKQFRSRIAFAVDTTSARAAGFMDMALIKYSFTHSTKGDGLFVLETPGVTSLMLAPVYDVKQKVLALDRRSSPHTTFSDPFQERFTTVSGSVAKDTRKSVKPDGNSVSAFSQPTETGENAHFAEVEYYLGLNWGKTAIIEKVWAVKAGSSTAYQIAKAEYETIIAALEEESEQASR